MTDDNPQQHQDGGAVAGRKYRAGHLTTFRVVDSITGSEITGHGLVLTVDGDFVELAIVGTGHIRTHVDNIAPAKLEDVHNPFTPPAEGTS